MYISDLVLDDFRSYRKCLLQLGPGIFVLVGSNGQGKTNLVEAISYLSSFSSHRVGTDSALVRRGGNEIQPEGAVIRSKVIQGNRERIIELEIIAGKANRARLNRNPVSVRQLFGIVKTVIFAPEDLSIVRGEPAGRRRFLDDLVGQIFPTAASDRLQYEKIARQRAALLRTLSKEKRKGHKIDEFSLQSWDSQLAMAGAKVMANRIKLIQLLTGPIELRYEQIANTSEKFSVNYKPEVLEILGESAKNISPEDLLNIEFAAQTLLRGISQMKNDELTRGVNLVGPHRDELELSIGVLPIRGFASHGESWSAALALRLGSLDVLKNVNNGAHEQPILILDDVFAELDNRRRDAMVSILSEVEQVFITAAVPEDIPPNLGEKRLHVRFDSKLGTVIEAADE